MTEPSVESVRKFLKEYGSDGWSILNPDALSKHFGFPKEWEAKLVYNHKSGGGKFDITDNSGKPVKSLKGIHTLTVIRRLAQQYGVTTRSYFGRGSEARACTEGILKVIGE